MGIGHSPVCQILLQIVVRAVIMSSPPAWTSYAGMLSIPADLPFFSDWAAASTSLQWMGWMSSVSVWGQFRTNGSLLALWLYSSQQYSVHLFSISWFARHFPEWSLTEVAFPCFTVVKSFTSWYASCCLFFLRFSTFSLHCSPIQLPFAFFMHHLMLFASLYFSDPSGSNLFLLSSLLLSQKSKISAVLKVVIIESTSVSSSFSKNIQKLDVNSQVSDLWKKKKRFLTQILNRG